MYFIFFSVLACLWTCSCLIENDLKNNVNNCSLLKQWLESSLVSMKITKKGFHREVVTTVELSPDVLSGVKVLLVHRWPRGVYVDPYQLASLSDQSDWQILLDSAIDLEVPAHKTAGFVTYVYPNPDEPTSRLLNITIPIHGRYHKPSFVGETFVTVNIEHPQVLLRTDNCTQVHNMAPQTSVGAPCSPNNSSSCLWVELQHQQEQKPLSVQLPVGDGFSVTPVCGGTLLVTMLCCVALSKHMWKHRII